MEYAFEIKLAPSERYLALRAAPSSGATRHLLPAGEKREASAHFVLHPHSRLPILPNLGYPPPMRAAFTSLSFAATESLLTRRIELLRLCARIGYSPH